MNGRKRLREPAPGTVLYEVGWKREKPAAPVITSYVYCGRITKSGTEYFLLVEFTKWWNRTQHGWTIEAEHGMKIPNLEQLLEGRETWSEVCTWVRKNEKGWRREMKE